jgi:endogenous inhibitor of DNA gyrase (YacG/DUF329 family)
MVFCPECGARGEWRMTSYAAGLDMPVFWYRCEECGKPFDSRSFEQEKVKSKHPP